ncbi:hypothetical protein FSP39_020342 [Pinctada imbricata]|uniref:Uncharacterized protein n=1 Tax=Pinctada imbricata TaxID=66713 RepID=A0AA88XQ05_PINIB|nr:hypothetical protein FSP39_020342 [Pinctada imbricata]
MLNGSTLNVADLGILITSNKTNVHSEYTKSLAHTTISHRDSAFPTDYTRNRRNAACPPSHPYNANGTCVKQCPADLPLIVTDNFPPNSYCTKHCPSSMYKNKNVCTFACDDDQLTIVDTRECYNGTSCPETYPLNQTLFGDKSCSSRCPISFIAEEKTNSCILFYLCREKIYHSSCVEKCPPFFYDSGPENLDPSEADDALSIKSIFHFRVCLSDFGYRVTAIVSFVLDCLIISFVMYFYFYERFFRIPKRNKKAIHCKTKEGISNNTRLQHPQQNTKTLNTKTQSRQTQKVTQKGQGTPN